MKHRGGQKCKDKMLRTYVKKEGQTKEERGNKKYLRTIINVFKCLRYVSCRKESSPIEDDRSKEANKRRRKEDKDEGEDEDEDEDEDDAEDEDKKKMKKKTKRCKIIKYIHDWYINYCTYT